MQTEIDFRKQNSLEAHLSVQGKLSSLHHQILYTLGKIGSGTFYDIAEAANLEPDQVWKRLSELEGKIVADGKKMGPKGRNVTNWKLNEK